MNDALQELTDHAGFKKADDGKYYCTESNIKRLVYYLCSELGTNVMAVTQNPDAVTFFQTNALAAYGVDDVEWESDPKWEDVINE